MAASPERLTWETPATAVRGIGPERAALLGRLGLATAGDLLRHRPRRYEDRTQFRAIGACQPGQAATVRGQVVAQGLKWYRQRRNSVVEVVIEDGTGRLHCRWWNQPFMEGRFAAGQELMVSGRLAGAKPRAMDHPEIEILEPGDEDFIHLNRWVPVYPLTEGLSQRWLRTLLWRVIEAFDWSGPDPWPEAIRDGFPTLADAWRALHFPESPVAAEKARERLALDELLELQVAVQRRRRNLLAHAPHLPCSGDNRWLKAWLGRLGYRLTEAQTRVLREIRADLASGIPMRRLLQGDVGSGKTVVAAATALMTLESGWNVALMAPTEILAEQHFRTFARWLEPIGIPVQLRTGSRPETTGDPPNLETGLDPASNPPRHAADVRLVVGTHALIQEGYSIGRLGLVIIDEQHKFGVAQRETLLRKGAHPHLLAMTATPIPRTLGLTLYGDLDLSVIDQMPAGRGRIRTFIRTPDRLPRIWEFLRAKLDEGRQAYVVYPLIEDADHLGLKAVTREYARLRELLAPHPVGLLHGRLDLETKEGVMRAFRENVIRVLLATTVVEVGLDVPNATVLVVENAGHYGLAQLHQLRGRIGRGAGDAWCILVTAESGPQARRRLQVLAETTDGFRIAETDLALRGPGEFLGRQQSGLPPFRFADLATDLRLVETARRIALGRAGLGDP